MDKSKWPLRSPDLNHNDFCLWGYLKKMVDSPSNIERKINLTDVLNSNFLKLKKKATISY